MPVTSAQIHREASLPGSAIDFACGRSGAEISAIRARMRLYLADQAVQTQTWRVVLDEPVIFPLIDRDPLDDEPYSPSLIVTVSAAEREAANRATTWLAPDATSTPSVDDEQ